MNPCSKVSESVFSGSFFIRLFLFLALPLATVTQGTAQNITFDWVNQPLAVSVFGGDDIGRAIVRDASGNLYMTGSFSATADFDPGAGTANLVSLGGTDIFIAKYDASGNYVWAKKLGNTSTDTGYGLVLDG